MNDRTCRRLAMLPKTVGVAGARSDPAPEGLESTKRA